MMTFSWLYTIATKGRKEATLATPLLQISVADKNQIGIFMLSVSPPTTSVFVHLCLTSTACFIYLPDPPPPPFGPFFLFPPLPSLLILVVVIYNYHFISISRPTYDCS